MLQVFNKKGGVVVLDVPPPVCEPGKVLVKNYASLISSGTETSGVKTASQSMAKTAAKNPDLVKKVLAMMKKNGVIKTIQDVQKLLKSKELSPMGYSSAGVVVEVGQGVTEISVGDKVACAGAHIANHADYVVVPKNLVARVPEGVDFEQAATTTVGSIALQGVRRADNQIGEFVVVSGLGLIGQITVQILKAAGCFTIGLDPDAERVKKALAMGLNRGVILGKEDPLKVIEEITNTQGADSVIICAATQSNEPLKQAMEMIRKRGKVVLVGVVGMSFPRSPFYEKEGHFFISTSYGPGRYDKNYEEKGQDYPIGFVRWTEKRNMEAYLNLIAQKKINLSKIISEKLPVKEAPQGYEHLMSAGSRPLGVILKYTEQIPDKIDRSITFSRAEKPGDRIKVAVIGAGGFAQAVHLPNMTALGDFDINTIVGLSGDKIKSAAEKWQAKKATTDYKEALNDPNIDLVVITTRHNTHAPMTIEAAKAGKNVFVEKPLAMNQEELNEIVEIVKKTKTRLMVGFNRRFAPFHQIVKKEIENISTPPIITYRVNGGKAPADAWVNDSEEGGGRIIGEGCHFIDLLSYFAGEQPKSVYARSLSAHSKNIIDYDNVICVFTYPSGAISTLIYTTEAASDLPKEKMEVHINEKSIVMDNYESLKFYGFGKNEIKAKTPDKGHKEEMRLVAEAIKNGKEMPIPLEDMVNTTRISFLILESIRKNIEITL
ncbi:MAG: bi-domain-containing oxidoreductase [Patescibacteria group bacterium]